jgi:methylenetetrahydrofolate dehydrogenase (NADP+) / methenyltetrahydrofolate cyclohydrolase
MSAQLINGKIVSDAILADLHTRVAARTAAGLRPPCLAVVLVGDDPASHVYVRNKEKGCATAGYRSIAHKLSADLPEADLLALIAELNADPGVDGILVQSPLPRHIDPNKVIEAILPAKDVDGFHPYNVGRLATKQPLLRSCTPRGVMTLLEHAGIDLVGKDAVVIGASNIVGRPMALELLLARATVTVCHSATRDLAEKVRAADVVVAAIGKPRFVPGSWIKPGAVVIDVGINRLPDGKLCGDVDFESAREVAGWITPVPGGVGPMTIATLLSNTWDAYLLSQAV